MYYEISGPISPFSLPKCKTGETISACIFTHASLSDILELTKSGEIVCTCGCRDNIRPQQRQLKCPVAATAPIQQTLISDIRNNPTSNTVVCLTVTTEPIHLDMANKMSTRVLESRFEHMTVQDENDVGESSRLYTKTKVR